MHDGYEVVPDVREFQGWPSERVREIAHGKTVVLALGGTGRWYFLEHGDPKSGYSAPERFTDYGRRVIRRTIELADLMYRDGVTTVFVMGFGGGQGERNREYVDNLRWAYELLVDDVAQEQYDKYQLSVMFRGNWQRLFDQLGADQLANRFTSIEERGACNSSRTFFWYVADDWIPQRVLPYAIESLSRTGQFPDHADMSQTYYGRDLRHVDIFIANNKPALKDMCPPLLTLGDLYFTVSPTLYLNQEVWRAILYDHVFARRAHHREYDKLSAEAIRSMREFYSANVGTVYGIGEFDQLTQTWRPLLDQSKDI